VSAAASAWHFRRDRIVVSVYTPWLSAHRPRVELGFMVRVRDPRAPFVGRYDPGHRSKRRAHWRWLKVYVGWTNPRLVDVRGRIFVAEAETHLTNGALGRTSYKTFARVKLAKGAGKKS
jgi:hypothetical protein